MTDFSTILDEEIGKIDPAPTGPVVPPQPSPDALPTNPFVDYLDQTDKRAAVKAEAVQQVYKKYGLDEAAGADVFAKHLYDTTGAVVDPSTLLGEGLQEAIAQRMPREDMAAAPKLAAWAASNPINAIVAQADRENLSLLESTVTGGVRRTLQLAKGTAPATRLEIATGQIRAAERAKGDRERSYVEIVKEELTANADRGENLGGYVLSGGFFDLAATPIDAFGRYVRSRLWSEEDDAEATEQGRRMAADAAGRLGAVVAEIERNWGGRTARTTALMEKLAEVEKLPAKEQLAATMEAFANDPLGTAYLGVELFGESAPTYIAMLAGGAAGGLGGAVIGAGVTSYTTSTVVGLPEIAGEMGYDLTRPEDVQRLYETPEDMARIVDVNHRYALTVAYFDALSGAAAGTLMAKSAVGNLVLQSVVQAGLGGGGELAGRLASGRDVSVPEVVLEMLGEFVGAPAEVVTAGVSKARDRAVQARQTRADQAYFKAIATAAENSEAREKTPERYREAVDAIVGGGHGEAIYVDGGRLDALFQSGEIDPVAFSAATGISLDDVQAAAANGGDVAIRTADFAAKIVGTPMDQAIRDNGRFDPERLSKVELEEAKAAQAEIDAVAAAAEKEGFAPEIEAARAEFETQLRNADRAPEVAKSEALQMAAVYQTLSARTGVAPAALLERFPMAQLATEQPTPADKLAPPLMQGTTAFDNWFGQSILRDEAGAPQVVYHGANGDFDAFKEGAPVWVTPDTGLASFYAETRRDMVLRGRARGSTVATVMPLYARVTKPFVIPSRFGSVEEVVALMREQGTPSPAAEALAEQLLSDTATISQRMVERNQPMASTSLWYPGQTLTERQVDLVRDTMRAFGFDAFQMNEKGVVTYGLLDPTQVKSVFNRGAYDINDPRVLFQSTALRTGKETLADFGLDPKKKYTTREVAVALEARTRAKTGIVKKGDFSEEAQRKLAAFIVEEVKFEVEQAKKNPEKSAVGWYTTKTQTAIDAIGETFPELVGDPEALALPGPASLGGTTDAVRSMFTAILALTSDGAKVADNFKRAVAIYGNWRDTAVLSAEGAPGSNRGSVPGNLAKLAWHIEQFGPSVFRDLFLERRSIRDLKRLAKENGVDLGAASKYAADMELPYSAIVFGPKLGAFYANLMGDTGYLTMDRWWSRTFNRYRGTLLPTVSKVGIERVRGLMAEAGVPGVEKMKQDEIVMLTIPYQKSYAAKGFKNGTELEKAANTIHKAAFQELEDVPFGAKDREFMVETVKRARANLARAGIRLSVADIQAVLWYYEKRLYGQLGARQTKDTSYEEAARDAARDYLAGRPLDEGAGEAGSAGGLDLGVDRPDADDLSDAAYERLARDDEQYLADARELAGLTGRFDEEEQHLQAGADLLAPLYQSAVDTRLPGLEPASPGRVPGVRETATEYMRSRGLPIRHQAEYVKVDVERAREIARLYDEMEDAPNDPVVRAAYEALARETVEQYRALEALGFTFEWITGDDPYTGGPREAIIDMQQNRHLWVYPTTSGFGTLNEATSDHPLLQPTGIIIDGRDALVNDLFRIVHDVFGHGSEGAAFGPRGEENAWQAHVRMFSPLAARAMTAETRGQNSWVNYGPHGEANRANPKDTVFADQKVGLLPPWVSEVGQAQDVPLGRDGEPITLTLDDFSRLTPELLQQPGWFVITGMKETSRGGTPEGNRIANEALKATLDKLGMPYLTVEGMYNGEPQGESYLVIGNEDAGLALGREFDQESILTNRGLEYSDGRPDTPHVPAETKIGEAAKGEDFYSVMPDGTAWSMGLDWSEPEPAPVLFQSAPPVDSAAFRAWFGDSKVVDENGKPLVVYHGTRGVFEVFDDQVYEATAQGFYFSPARGVAEVFRDEGFASLANPEGERRVLEVYLSLQNPADLRTDEGISAVWSALREGGVSRGDLLAIQPRDVWMLFYDGDRTLLEALEKVGYDGAIITEPDFAAPTYIAFRPTQIKSVDNRGTFDPADPRILYQSMPARMYRSALSDGIRGAKQAKAKGKDWLAILPKLPGVKEVELVWTGILDWLEKNKDATITREELLRQADTGAIQLSEVERLHDDGDTDFEEYIEGGDPAGLNYREFLLTVPGLENLGPNRDRGRKPYVYDQHYQVPNIVTTARTTDRGDTLFIEEVQSDLASEHRKAGTSWKDAEPPVPLAQLQAQMDEATAEWDAAKRDFVAALRAVAPSGHPDLFLEMFADFAAASATATARGARAPRPTQDDAELLEHLPKIDHAIFQRLQEARLGIHTAQEAMRQNDRFEPPFTPFEGAAAYELMAKRMLRLAVREGYDRLAWTPAYMQARRWNQAAQSVVEGYDWRTDADGRKLVDIGMAEGGYGMTVTVDAEGVIVSEDSGSFAQVVGQPLSALLGSAAAEIMAEPSGSRDNANITFPSSGYAVAYERHFKGAIEKLTKKLGGKIELVTDVLPEKTTGRAELADRLFAEYSDLDGIDGFVQRYPENEAGLRALHDTVIKELQNEAALDEYTVRRDEFLLDNRLVPEGLLEELQAKWAEKPIKRSKVAQRFSLRIARAHPDLVDAAPVGETVFAIRITEQMKKALAEPFALFQEKRGSVALPTAAGQRPVITLYNGADLSTVLHESGHIYMHMLEGLIESGDASPSMLEDWRTLQGWWLQQADQIAAEVGVTPDHVRAYLDGEPMDADSARAVWTGLQERFARGIEAYLTEGKAPSIGLRQVFANFAAWLKVVYAKVRGVPDVQLTDEVRLVFDRLFATDEEIAAAALGDGTIDAEAARKLGASEAEVDALARLAIERMDEAQAFMLGIAGGAFRKQRRADYRRRRAQISKDVTAAVNQRPIYQALAWLTGEDGGGRIPPTGKLNAQALRDVYDIGIVERLERLGIVAADGLDPDEVASEFGFPSGDAMIQSLLTAPPKGRAIRQEIRAALKDEFGDTPQARAAALPEALNGDKRGQQLQAELRVLTGLLPGGRTATTRRQAAVIAAQTIRKLPVRAAIRSEDYLAAERRAGAAVQRALVKGDVGAAAKAKRDQLFQHALYVESRKAAELTAKAERKAKQLQSAGTRKNLAGEYLGAIDEVLETYDFRKISGAQEQRRGRLAAYVAMMEEQGRAGEVLIPDEVLNEVRRRPYKTLTVAELEGVYDTLRNIEHTARTANKLRSADRERSLTASVDAIVGEMDANLPDVPQHRVATQMDRMKAAVRNFANIALNVETRLRSYGGFKRGEAYRQIKGEIDAAAVWATTQHNIAAQALNDLVGMYTKAERAGMHRKRHHPVLGMELSRWELIAAGLNMGNADNLDRLRATGTKWELSEAKLAYIRDALTQKDWEFIQAVWDYLDTFWPLIAERERRVTGVAPKRVEPVPLLTPYGELRGGYYPIRYDADLSVAVQEEQLQEQLASMQAGRFGKAHTKNGHTKERVGSGGRVLSLSIDNLFRHVNDVIHDLAFSEATANAWRILRHPKIVDAFARKGLRPDLDMLEIWVQDVAVGSGVGGGVLGRLAMNLKGNFTVSRLALNGTTALLQISGVSHSIVQIGVRHVLGGYAQYAAHTARSITSVFSLSPMMRERSRIFHPDAMEYVREGQRGSVTSVADNTMRAFARWGLAPMQFLQFYGVDIPLWLGAHAKALSQGMSPEEAVVQADRDVIRAQGGPNMVDRTAFERGTWSRDTRYNGFLRLWATLASYMMVKGNLGYEAVVSARRQASPEAYLAAAAKLMLVFVVDAVAMGIVKGEIDWGDEDEDKPGFLEYALFKSASSVMGTVPILRDVAGAMEGFEPGMYGSLVSTVVRPVAQMGSAALDPDVDLDPARVAKALSNALGLFAPFPSGQANRIIDAANAPDGEAAWYEYLFGVRK